MNEKVIIPVSKDHIRQLKLNLPFIRKNLNPSAICIIGCEDVIETLRDFDDVEVLNENELFDDLNYEAVAEIIRSRCGDTRRTGWYFQQFLKMQYATICNEDYYIVWDADTIPLRKIDFIDNEGKYLYNLKEEHHIPYFKTLDNLFGEGFLSYAGKSFISEGMVFDTQIMRELLDLIISVGKKGVSWFKTVIDSIPVKDIRGSGFSEFETYGSYVMKRHPDRYRYRKLLTMREGYDEFGRIPEGDELDEYIAHYDTISFENRYSRNVYLPDIPSIVNLKNDVLTAKNLYFSSEEIELFIRHEGELLNKGKKAKRIYLYGAGHFGNQYRYFFRIKGLEEKLAGYIVTELADTSCYGMSIFSADEFFNDMYDEDDLVVFCIAEPARRELLESIDLNEINHIECVDSFAENIKNIVTAREVEGLISRYAEPLSNRDGSDTNTVLIVDLLGESDTEDFYTKHVDFLGDNNISIEVDMIVRDGAQLPEYVNRRIRNVFYYKITDSPETYSKRMKRRVSNFISHNDIGRYDLSVLVGEMPCHKSRNYLDGALLCMKCSYVRKGYLNADSRTKKYYAKIWNRAFDLQDAEKLYEAEMS